jgi:CrcB protein
VAHVAGLLAWVALGSALGGAARFLVSGAVARSLGETFPWGTMVVNVTGALAIGGLAGLAESQPVLARPEAWPLVVTGFLGSYTTVSSLSLQTLALLRDGEAPKAAGNVLLSLLFGLAAVAGGFAAARVLA